MSSNRLDFYSSMELKSQNKLWKHGLRWFTAKHSWSMSSHWLWIRRVLREQRKKNGHNLDFSAFYHKNKLAKKICIIWQHCPTASSLCINKGESNTKDISEYLRYIISQFIWGFENTWDTMCWSLRFGWRWRLQWRVTGMLDVISICLVTGKITTVGVLFGFPTEI